VRKFRSAKNDIVTLNSDLQNNRPGKKAAGIKNITLDFCNKLISYSFQQTITPLSRPYISGTPSLPSAITITQERPPDLI
jgi:hypothetical protein